MNNLNFIFNFARKYGKCNLAIDLIEYLINHDGEYRGSYYDLSEKIRGNRANASNLRVVVIRLAKEGILYAETYAKTHGTYIVLDENWEEILK